MEDNIKTKALEGDGSVVHHKEARSAPSYEVKLDKHGLPLIPQPSNYKDDPLNWPRSLKLAVLAQVSMIAFLGNAAASVINPAWVQLAQAFDISTVHASYLITAYALSTAVGPVFVGPLSNAFGRRPLYLAGTLLAAVGNFSAGVATSWQGLVVTRIFCGIGAGCSGAIGAASVCDLFFLHERGLYMGIYTLFLTNGPHVAPVAGGFAAQRLGWRECFSIPSYFQFAAFAIILFGMPETLYSRPPRGQSAPASSASSAVEGTYKESSFLDLLLFRGTRRHGYERVSLSDCLRPFRVLRYVCVTLPTVYYMTCFGYGTVIFAATGSEIFREEYGFDIIQTGLMLSIPLLLGCLVGEANAGWFTDWLVYQDSRKHNGVRRPEPRLDALWLALLLPVGLVIHGVCISHAKTTGWVGNAFGMGITNLGLQVATTVVYTYCTDCYKAHSVEISAVIFSARNIYSCVITFYAIPLAKKIGYQYAWLVFALINLVTMLPMLLLRLRGGRIRASKRQQISGIVS